MKNALRVAALSVLVVATLAGCFKAKVDVTLSSDDTVSGTMLVAIQSGLGESLGASDDEILEQLSEGAGDELEGAKVEDYDADGYIGKIYTFAGLPLDTFASGEDGSDISITREGDLFIVDGAWNTDDTDTEGIDPTALGAEFSFAVTFPGSVTDHNGTLSDDGHTVTWDLFSGPETLHAEGKATADGGGWAVWALITAIAALVIAAVVVTAVIVRRRARSTATPAIPAPAAPPVEFSAQPAAEAVPGAAPAAPEPPTDFAAPEPPTDEQPK